MGERKRKLFIKVMAIVLAALMVGGLVGTAVYFILL